ncbi:MAG TPA: sigma-70 family RNA polymerase sigma factor [Thermoanaerobaculia bacterium]
MSVLTTDHFDEGHFEAIYEQYFDLLLQIAVYKFKVPDFEADALVHDVLLGYLRKADSIIDLRSWLIGAICYASRHYWRLNKGHASTDDENQPDPPDPMLVSVLDSLPDQIAARELMSRLPLRAQQILHMRFFEGCSMIEIGERLGVRSKYAQKLVAKYLKRAADLSQDPKKKTPKKKPATKTKETP